MGNPMFLNTSMDENIHLLTYLHHVKCPWKFISAVQNQKIKHQQWSLHLTFFCLSLGVKIIWVLSCTFFQVLLIADVDPPEYGKITSKLTLCPLFTLHHYHLKEPPYTRVFLAHLKKKLMVCKGVVWSGNARVGMRSHVWQFFNSLNPHVWAV